MHQKDVAPKRCPDCRSSKIESTTTRKDRVLVQCRACGWQCFAKQPPQIIVAVSPLGVPEGQYVH